MTEAATWPGDCRNIRRMLPGGECVRHIDHEGPHRDADGGRWGELVPCGHNAVFWPDDECIDVHCERALHHIGPHQDGDLTWDDEDGWAP